jgi:hypothetical protein
MFVPAENSGVYEFNRHAVESFGAGMGDAGEHGGADLLPERRSAPSGCTATSGQLSGARLGESTGSPYPGAVPVSAGQG